MPAISGKKLVFTGGASQVGSHIGEQLLAGGAREVELLDNLSLGSIETMQAPLADARCSFVRADVLRLNELFDPVAQADGVFHVADIMATTIRPSPGAREGWRSPTSARLRNSKGHTTHPARTMRARS